MTTRARARVDDANDVECLRARVGVARGEGTARDDVGTRRGARVGQPLFERARRDRGMEVESV